MYAIGAHAPAFTLGPARERSADRGVRSALGEEGWARLPAAVQARFADCAATVEYVGSFEVVRASLSGLMLALLCRLIGTPIAPYTGAHVPATVRVYGGGRGGVVWERNYRFPGRRPCVVRSTKRCNARGALVEELPCGLSMPLAVFERGGVLHFLSTSYVFSCLGLRLTLPRLLPPGRTHVEHIDEGLGWFRFTMTVTHPWLGEVYFQTGRFHAASEGL